MCTTMVYEHAIDGESSGLAALVPDTFAGVHSNSGKRTAVLETARELHRPGWYPMATNEEVDGDLYT